MLKREGERTAAEIGTALGVTSMAARLQLYALEEEGLVHARSEPQGRGRPQKIWSLTEASSRVFPDAHQSLAVEIARGWRDEFSRSVSLKLNAFFLAPHCEALSAYLRDGLLELDVDEIRLTIPEPSERPAERAELLKVESAALAADKEKLRRLAPLLRPLKR